MIHGVHWVLHVNKSRGNTEVDRRDDGEMSPQAFCPTPSQDPKGQRKDGNYSLWLSSCLSLENDGMKRRSHK